MFGCFPIESSGCRSLQRGHGLTRGSQVRGATKSIRQIRVLLQSSDSMRSWRLSSSNRAPSYSRRRVELPSRGTHPVIGSWTRALLRTRRTSKRHGKCTFKIQRPYASNACILSTDADPYGAGPYVARRRRDRLHLATRSRTSKTSGLKRLLAPFV